MTAPETAGEHSFAADLLFTDGLPEMDD